MSSLFGLLLAACLLLSVSAHYPDDYGYGTGYGYRSGYGSGRGYYRGYGGGYRRYRSNYGRRGYGYRSGYGRPSYRNYNHYHGY